MNLKLFTIKRTTYNDEGTWGIFEYNYRPFAVSGELPWHDNKQEISCIPPGCYTAQVQNHSQKGMVLRLMDVPGRDGVLVHVGNIPKHDSLGCILIGESFEPIDDMQAVTNSGKARNELLSLIAGDKQVLLKIEDHR